MFAGSKDLLGLVLFGTADTDNELASDGDEGYQNIMVPYRPAQPSVEFLEFLCKQVKSGSVSGDFIDAVVVALDILVKSAESIKKVGEKRIYLMTDAGSEFNDDQLSQICDGLKKCNVELIVVGPGVASEARRNGGEGPSDDGPGPSHHPRPPPVLKRTPQQLAGEALIGRLVEEVEGVCFSFNEALQVSTFIRKHAKKQTARFVGQLEIGDRLKIPCKMFTKVMIERPASWKKVSAVSQAAASGGNMAVKMQRSHRLNDDNETEVEVENVAKGYRYGKSLVPISEADETAMKFEADRCLSLMGFTKIENVKPHQFIGSSTLALAANPDNENAGRALSAFIHALYETNMVGIARYVWRKNSQPKVVALLPKIKAECEYLVVLQLPFMEDARQFVFGSLPGERQSSVPSDEQLNAMDNLITNMNLMTADVDEDGEPCEALKPKKTCNPLIQRSFQCIALRALNSDDPVPELEESLKRLMQPSPSIVASCGDGLQRIKNLFPLEKIVKKSKDDGATAQVWQKSSDLDLDSGPPTAKRPHTDDVDFSMASLAKGEVIKVGSLNPVSDYQSLIANKNFGFAEASKQLGNVAQDFVKESFGVTLYEKAMDCVKALREEAIKHSEPETFNSFLRKLKDEFLGTRYSPFWSKVLEETVTLISSSESGSSPVSPEQAIEFMESGLTISDAGPPAGEVDEDDPDNLLELM